MKRAGRIKKWALYLLLALLLFLMQGIGFRYFKIPYEVLYSFVLALSVFEGARIGSGAAIVMAAVVYLLGLQQGVALFFLLPFAACFFAMRLYEKTGHIFLRYLLLVCLFFLLGTGANYLIHSGTIWAVFSDAQLAVYLGLYAMVRVLWAAALYPVVKRIGAIA